MNEWRRGQGNGPGREIPHYLRISAWREAATVLSEHRKGAPLMIKGRLTTDSWTDESGTKHSVTKVEARELVTLTGRPTPASEPAPTEDDLPF